jgi:hypothetical protein
MTEQNSSNVQDPMDKLLSKHETVRSQFHGAYADVESFDGDRTTKKYQDKIKRRDRISGTLHSLAQELRGLGYTLENDDSDPVNSVEVEVQNDSNVETPQVESNENSAPESDSPSESPEKISETPKATKPGKVRLAQLEDQIVQTLTERGTLASAQDLVVLISEIGTPTVDAGCLQFYTAEKYGTRQDREIPRWISGPVENRIKARLPKVPIQAKVETPSEDNSASEKTESEKVEA